jgi:tetratricopeptide (TPR) repeat protein
MHVRDSKTPEELAMESIGRGNVVATILIWLLLGSALAAQDPERKISLLENVALCNGSDRTSPEPQINGCTAVIDAGERTAAAAIAYNNRGDAYTSKGDYDRAIQDFDQSIKLQPTNAKPFNNRGVAYLKKGEYDLAIKSFDEAVRLDAGYAKAFINRAESYQKKNEHDRAVRDYDEAIRLEPSSKAAWNGRCWARAILGELQPALEDCNKALQSDPTAAIYDSRGLTYMKMGRFDAAIDDYNSALRFEPKLASALYGRGLGKFKKGDRAGGDADISAAKKIQANIAEDFRRYGLQ